MCIFTGRAASASTPLILDDINLVKCLLRGGPSFWGHFSQKRVRRAVAYYRSGFARDEHAQADIDPETGEEPTFPQEEGVPLDRNDWYDVNLNIDDYINYDAPLSETDLPSEIPIEMPAEAPFAKASRLVNKGLRFMNDVIRARDAGIQVANSRAEAAEAEVAYLREELDADIRRAQRMADDEIARVREEYEVASYRAAESAEARVRRARRAGKRQISAEMTIRRERFVSQYTGAAEAREANGVFREQRGIVGGLHLTRDAKYSYDAVFPRQESRTAKLEKRKTKLPDVEAQMWDLWNPIAVSPDSVEVGPDIPDISGEVDQPRGGSDACQGSTSGFYT